MTELELYHEKGNLSRNTFLEEIQNFKEMHMQDYEKCDERKIIFVNVCKRKRMTEKSKDDLTCYLVLEC